MKIFLLILLFAPIIVLAARHKKWYLYLMFAFIGILPEHFALELHDKLPLISASRILILIVLGFWIYDKWKHKKWSFPVSILVFLGVNLLVSFVNFRYGMGEINRIFLFVFERVLVVIMAVDLIRDRAEFERCMDFMILSCIAVAVIGIVQTVYDYDIASALYVSDRSAYTILTQRMGMTRAYATFNAISYGCYCSVMALIIYYRMEQTGKKWYSFAFALNAVALMCTFSRSAWLCLAGIVFLLLVVRRGQFFRRMLPSAGLFILICALLCVLQPKVWGGLSETFKSSVNTVLAVLPDGVTDGEELDDGKGNHKPHKEEKPGRPEFELSEEFGLNGGDPTSSRMVEWTAVKYMANEGELLFGYGYNAFPRGRLNYFYPQFGHWTVAETLDVGLLALMTEGGLIGFLSMMGLLGFMVWESIRRRDRSRKFDFYKLTIYMVIMYLLLNFMAAFLQTGTMWLFFALFYAYRNLDKKNCLGEAEPGKLEEKK